MPKLPVVSGQEAINILEKLGFIKSRQKGSHVILKRILAGEDIGCVVPLHKELAIGTLRSILRLARISTEEFLEIYKK